MARRDYYDDPSAPEANRIVPAVSAVVIDDGRILLGHRVDNDQWALPGGALEPGESASGAAQRETLEETGIHVQVVGLVGIYTDPRHVIEYDNGEIRQQFSICLRAKPMGGELKAQLAENRRVAWVPLIELDDLPIHPAQRLRIDQGIAWRVGDPAHVG